MGNLCSGGENLTPEEKQRRKEEKARSKALDKKNMNDMDADNRINKLLLLGAGESGKSTLFKQMITIYGNGFPVSERKTFDTIIYSNVIGSLKTLLRESETYGKPAVDLGESIKQCQELKGDETIDSSLAAHIDAVWKDPGIQTTYENRAKFQLTDSAQYFFDKIEEIGAEGYLPTLQDVLRSRVRTTGIVENSFMIDGNQFKMFDVGGQRNERKKWIHCFENVTAVLFVAALSAYDLVLYEDENTNRMVEALDLFEEICNSRWFVKTSMILMLNKKDMFLEKCGKVPIGNYFPDYRDIYGDDCTYESGVEFLVQEFEGRNADQEKKQVYTHVTCATDTGNVEHVFNAVKDIIIRQSLESAGLT